MWVDNFEKVDFSGGSRSLNPFFILILHSRSLESLVFYSHFSHHQGNLDHRVIHFHWMPVSTSAWILASHDLKPYLKLGQNPPSLPYSKCLLSLNSFIWLVVLPFLIPPTFVIPLPATCCPNCPKFATIQRLWSLRDSASLLSLQLILFLPSHCQLPHHLLTGLLSTSQCFS